MSAMTLEAWQSRNDAYLSAALSVMRLRLTQAAPPAIAAPRAQPESAAEAEAEAGWNPFRRKATTPVTPVPETRRLPAPEPASAPSLADALHTLATAGEGDPPPALQLLAQRLGLSEFERDLLMLCVAMELDTRTANLCARAQDDNARAYPTFALGMAVLDTPAWEALSPERPLRYWRLLEISQPGAQPLTSSALRADERIVSFIKGLNYLDDRLAPLLSPMGSLPMESLPASQRECAERATAAASSQTGGSVPVVLIGRDRESKRQVAAATAAAVGLHLYRLPAEALPAHAGELETLARLWQRENLLLPLALYLDADDLDRSGSSGTEAPLQRVTRFVARTGGLMFIAMRDVLTTSIDARATLEVSKPTPAEQHEAWVAALGEQAGNLPAVLAGQFNLNQPEIVSIAEAGLAESAGQSLRDRLWNRCRARTRPTLEKLAEKLETKATWEQIVLPKAEGALLRQIAAQVDARAKVYDEWGFRDRMNRGFGITALFAGDSGTGKTMAAEVLANELQLDCYRIDLSAVVSKYIGETEKNLRQVFDAAEDGGAILLFDEADALFGKRSEVKDSHDRYANIEINYLLQRMEAYRGLAILATNMKSALDSAFMRRLRFIVNFPFPGASERREIWRRAFPAGMPVGVLDYERLGRLNLTGGNIHSIALNAAFLAAKAGTPVTMHTVLEAARTELRKLDRPVNESDFRCA
jgi:hypothetical protein